MKFGEQVLTNVVCARVRLTVRGIDGNEAHGWGETPLSTNWAWPSAVPFDVRQNALLKFCGVLATAWPQFEVGGHPLEVGYDFLENELPILAHAFETGCDEPLPQLAALVCASAFDLALHDAYGNLHGVPVYATYNGQWMNYDLAAYLSPVDEARVNFAGKYPQDFFSAPTTTLKAWHAVGGLDPLKTIELTGSEPEDGYPVLLKDWIKRDGLTCLKIKLRGTDADWDYQRLRQVGFIAGETGVDWISADFNCTVQDVAYVNTILDRLRDEAPRTYGMLLYVEQPFAYELEEQRLDVHSVSARKPLLLDESAHDWRLVKLGYQLGWNGVALKTCKTQTGALLSLSWARAHGMAIMVMDLTNPRLAQIPHALLGAHSGSIMGLETNAPQFYPEASLPEAKVHPGLYERNQGRIDLSSITGPGFGYRIDEIERELPEPAVSL